MKRQKHSLSHYKLTTCKMGQLIPVGLIEALPGDTFQHSSSILLRMSPLVAPVMHPVSVRLHHFFVPHRLTFPAWEEFITGGPDGEDATNIPTNVGVYTPSAGTVQDYLGVPPGVTYPSGAISYLPLYAYNTIFNEYYRDQDLVTPVALTNNVPQKVAWEKDYFTTARPWAQKGAEITLPLGSTAPVTGSIVAGAGTGPTFDGPGAANDRLHADVTAGNVSFPPATGAGTGYLDWGNPDLALSGASADLSSATAVDVNQVRRAFALQRYQEARAQYGSRYTEYLRYLGVRSSDARLQRPEYLGGGKQTIAFSEVLRTGNTDDTDPDLAIGSLKGHGISAMRSNRYRYFCEEHGYIMSLLSIRPRSMYVDGLHRTFSKRAKEDYYQKELELIGQQEVYNRELYTDGSADDNLVFGYQDRYSEYRSQPSQVSGQFRSTLDYWHLGRQFADHPTLNSTFINCDPAVRIFAEQTQDNCWLMVSHSIQARRMVGKKTLGRII